MILGTSFAYMADHRSLAVAENLGIEVL